MAMVLSVVADPKEDGRSVSKKMLDAFLQTYTRKHPDDQIEILDLYQEQVPNLSDEYIKVVYEKKDPKTASKQTNEMLKKAETYINMLLSADIIVVTLPMWNFNVPSVFKAYIDLVVYPQKTFAFKGPGQMEGLLKNKKLICLGSRGGVYSEGPYKAFDHQGTWLKGIFGFLGITDVQSVWSEGTGFLQGDELTKSINNAISKAGALA